MSEVERKTTAEYIALATVLGQHVGLEGQVALSYHSISL